MDKRSLSKQMLSFAAFLAVCTLYTSGAWALELSISLKSAHNRYMVAERNGTVRANRKRIGPWEKFKLILHKKKKGYISLKSAHGRYLVAEKNGTVKANRRRIGPWEMWKLIKHKKGYISLKSAHGRYLVAEKNGTIKANRKRIGAWEKFKVRLHVERGSGGSGGSSRVSCKDFQNSAQLARTAYNSSASDKKKYLPSGHSYVKMWNIRGEHAYLAMKSGICNYVFRGLSGNISVKAFFKLGQRMTCKTAKGQSMGSCIKNGYKRYQKIRGAILSDLNKRKCKAVYIHGHSMGGVHANLFAAELYLRSPRKYNKRYMKVFTYGALRVFEKSAADKWHRRLNAHRWTFHADPVPAYPSRVDKFKHLGRAYRIYKYHFFGWRYKYQKKSQDYQPFTIVYDHKPSHYTDGLRKCKL